MANGIDPRRLVSHEGDLEEAAREYEASKKKPEPKLVSHEGDLVETPRNDDKSKTGSGVSYADYAKACTSMTPENCPVEGWHIDYKPVQQLGTRGFDASTGKDDEVQAVANGKVGLQNELNVGVVGKDHKVGPVRFTQAGPSFGAHGGFHNPDDSLGVNGGAQAQLASGGAKLETPIIDLGLTASVGLGTGGSAGIQERADGTTRACAEADVAMFTGNVCIRVR